MQSCQNDNETSVCEPSSITKSSHKDPPRCTEWNINRGIMYPLILADTECRPRYVTEFSICIFYIIWDQTQINRNGSLAHKANETWTNTYLISCLINTYTFLTNRPTDIFLNAIICKTALFLEGSWWHSWGIHQFSSIPMPYSQLIKENKHVINQRSKT